MLDTAQEMITATIIPIIVSIIKIIMLTVYILIIQWSGCTSCSLDSNSSVRSYVDKHCMLLNTDRFHKL